MLGSLDCCVGIGAGRWSAGAERAGALGLRALGLTLGLGLVVKNVLEVAVVPR